MKVPHDLFISIIIGVSIIESCVFSVIECVMQKHCEYESIFLC